MSGGDGRYGGYALKLGDNDAERRYGALVRPNQPGDPLPARGSPGFVAQLQQDLTTLGFLEPGEGTPGTFDTIVKWAVREFQIVASALGKGGAALLNPAYSGPLSAAQLGRHTLVDKEIYSKSEGISGVAGQGTTAAISAWIDGHVRCPVVFQSYETFKSPWRFGKLIEEGFWQASRRFRPGASGSFPCVFACDFTGDYDTLPAPDADKIPKAPIGARCYPVGHRAVYSYDDHQTVGPTVKYDIEVLVVSRRAAVAVSPTTLIGKQWTALTDAEKSTYRVIRAVAQAECTGKYDAVNAYDDGWISAGLYHPTAFTRVSTDQVTKAELGAFLAYVKSQAASTFGDLFENRGVSVKELWGDKTIYNSSQAKYEANISFQGADNQFTAVTSASDADYLRNWPWFYRFEMAFRAVDKLRLLWWPYGRQRLADILSTPWPAPAPGGGKGVTIGNVFRSEASVAALLRWHVLMPKHIVQGGQAGAMVQKIFAKSKIDPKLMLSKYGSTEEQKLLDAIHGVAATAGSPELKDTLNRMRAGSRGQAGGTSDPGATQPQLGIDPSFQFFADGIPFPRTVSA